MKKEGYQFLDASLSGGSPDVLKRNMVGYLRTPIVKMFKGNRIVHRFFNNKTYEDWISNLSIFWFSKK